MSKKNRNVVSIEVCTARHTALLTEIGRLSKEVDDVKKALIGEDMQSGLVKTVRDVKNTIETLKHGSLSGKDTAAIVIAVVSAIAAIIVALVK